MNNHICLVLFLLSYPISQSIFAPMSIRTFDYLVDDICVYQISGSDFIYVEPCQQNYTCQQINSVSSLYLSIGICKKHLKADLAIETNCEEDEDCYTGLNCVEHKCTLSENSPAVDINDYKYCPEELIPIEIGSVYTCKKRNDYSMDNLCFRKDENGIITSASPGFMKICGEITLDSEEKNYDHLKTTANLIGSVEDGKFVENEKACKSGFALEFYPDGKITTTQGYGKYYKCLQFDGIEYKDHGSCKIKYILNQKNYEYDVDKADSNIIYDKQTFCSSFNFKETKLDLFKKYVDRLNELGDNCINSKYYDEPFTCRDDELRKFFYFYENIEEYLLYKNEDEVMEFILQTKYPSYDVKYSKTDGSNYLSNKFIFLLIFLF